MTSDHSASRVAVTAIRPDDLAPLVRDAVAADNAWIASRRHTFGKGACPLCGPHAPSVPAYTLNNGISYDRCAACSTLFLHSHPDEQGYKEFYETSAMMRLFATHIFPQSRDARLRNIYIPRLKRMLAYFENTSRGEGEKVFLEIGAGSGIFTKVVKDSGVFSRCMAVEPNPACARSCRDNGIAVIEKPIELVEDAEAFAQVSLVGCFEVLEHLVDPAAFLARVHALLPDGGMFCLTTPNGLGFDILELQEKSTTLGIAHVHLFNPESLSGLLGNVGFTVLEIATPGTLDVDLVERGYRENGVPATHSWLSHILLNGNDAAKNALQNFLVSNRQSSHMWAICVKQ